MFLHKIAMQFNNFGRYLNKIIDFRKKKKKKDRHTVSTDYVKLKYNLESLESRGAGVNIK